MITTCQSHDLAKRVLVLVFASVILTACSAGKDPVSLDPSKNFSDVLGAVRPLEDLNLRRQEIPPLLKTAAKDPYAPPAKLQCAILQTEVTALDTILGADVEIAEAKAEVAEASEDDDDLIQVPDMPKMSDIPEVPTSETVVNKGAHAIHDRALDFIRDQTDILPFRSIIRTITGADRHARRVSEAQHAGQLRRAYLKGLAQAKFGKSCIAPAATQHAKAEIVKPKENEEEEEE